MCTRAISILVLIIFVNLFEYTVTFSSDELKVTLSNGNRLMGKYEQTLGGRAIKSFTGIPYAKPPVGQLRFRDPKAFGTWPGVRLAVDEGPMCPQRHLFERDDTDWGEENCLVLNVYVPHSVDGPLKNLPVMFYIHGGGFTCGAGIIRGYGPGHLLDKDVILVTINYRLGILGFLSTEDENCPGNFGLKDQVMALKWVHANIRNFGGDPNSVTIFGGSAGGASVTYLMASPLAKGYFARAIAHSGTNLAPWSQPANKGFARNQAKKLTKMLNCDKGNWTQSLNCLRRKPYYLFSMALSEFFEYDFDRMNAFPPVVDNGMSSKPFLLKHPNDLLREQPQTIPLMTGINYDEGLLKTAAMFNNPELFVDLAQKFEFAVPIIFYYDHFNKSVRDDVSEKIKNFYFENGVVTKTNILNITNLYGDGWFLSAMDLYLRLRLAHNDTAQTYAYLLTNKINISFSTVFRGNPNTFYGVSHSDEELYLFPDRQIFFAFMQTLPTKEEVIVRNAMIDMWTNFARTGNPNPPSSNLPKWDQISRFPIDYYRIGNLNFNGKPLFGMDVDLFENRSAFWRELGLYSTKKYPTNDELNVFLRNNSKVPSSVAKMTHSTWIWVVACSLYSVLILNIVS